MGRRAGCWPSILQRLLQRAVRPRAPTACPAHGVARGRPVITAHAGKKPRYLASARDRAEEVTNEDIKRASRFAEGSGPGGAVFRGGRHRRALDIGQERLASSRGVDGRARGARRGEPGHRGRLLDDRRLRLRGRRRVRFRETRGLDARRLAHKARSPCGIYQPVPGNNLEFYAHEMFDATSTRSPRSFLGDTSTS